MTTRTIARLHAAYRDDIGDLSTRRPLPGPAIDQLDPFLFLNHHGPQTYRPNNRGLPFGPHPHRGFETVTFILEGQLSHLDSGGHESVIDAGGVQWMTAGSGLVHAELSPEAFKRSGGPLEILQLWVNLPRRLKMTAPRYVGLQAPDIPKIEKDGATIELISGEIDGVAGPIESLTGVAMSVARLEAGADLSLPIPAGRAVFLYVVRGSITIGDRTAGAANLVELTDGEGLELSSADGAVLLLGHADPIREPVVSHGPFVMTTREEIIQAIQDYQAGKFGEVRA
ncbi:nuclease PIN [Caulobacter sp. D4A]|uniref:pirin family protein n=1 Tax=unclassified Caulobacter TaxID=2648921 RepID=UPI000D73D7FC|nr:MULTISPECIES: pirin family protein [unclassified Caulobacter]PXA79099.1 nuclease PIN [Caulobacter sp. D4A]PXA82594.1 nuclease PIN [Caulobacter sp. D5]